MSTLSVATQNSSKNSSKTVRQLKEIKGIQIVKEKVPNYYFCIV